MAAMGEEEGPYGLPIGVEMEWTPANAATVAAYGRYDSIKGTANPKSWAQNQPRHRPASQPQPAPAPAPAIIGPAPQPARHPRRPLRGTADGALRDGDNPFEPKSPTVSCIGRVNSNRERGGEGKGGCCWGGCFGGDKPRPQPPPAARTEAAERCVPVPAAELELGATKRLGSGRKAASWGGEMEDAPGFVAKEGRAGWSWPLMRQRSRRSSASAEDREELIGSW